MTKDEDLGTTLNTPNILEMEMILEMGQEPKVPTSLGLLYTTNVGEKVRAITLRLKGQTETFITPPPHQAREPDLQFIHENMDGEIELGGEFYGDGYGSNDGNGRGSWFGIGGN